MGKITRWIFLFLGSSLVFSFASVRFPARGFAKILTDEAAQQRLSDYRSFVLQDSNQSSFHRGFAMNFKLRHMPRRGSERVRTGTLLGPYLGSGVTRLLLKSDSGNKKNEYFLFQNGQTPKIWKSNFGDIQAKVITQTQFLEPLVGGMNQTAFDLLMPFIFWQAEYEMSGKVAGRPAHLFSFKCPVWMTEKKPNWHKITLALDDTYDAPLRVEILGVDQVPERTLILRSFKKLQDQWIVKEIDCRDRQTRSVTRMQITSSALGLDFDSSVFLPSGLSQSVQIDPKLFNSTD